MIRFVRSIWNLSPKELTVRKWLDKFKKGPDDDDDGDDPAAVVDDDEEEENCTACSW